MVGKHRLIMLIASGVLLLVAVCYVVWHHSSKKEDVSAELDTNGNPAPSSLPAANRIPSINKPIVASAPKDNAQVADSKPEADDKQNNKNNTAPDKAVSIDGKLIVAATSREAAGKEAKEVAGRQDPMMHIDGYLPFPISRPMEATQPSPNKNQKISGKSLPVEYLNCFLPHHRKWRN